MKSSDFFAAENGIILAGQIALREQLAAAEELLALSAKTGWPIFADALSGLRGFPGVVQHADAILHRPPPAKPERLLQVGESFVSRRVAEWLQPVQGEHYWQVRKNPSRRDPFFQNPTIVSAVSAADGPARAGWRESWQIAEQKLETLCREQLDPLLCEPATARAVGRQAIQAGALFLGNSMPVRDFDTFASLPAPLRLLGNRGASGIDGNIATAAGAACQLQRPVVALIGDLTALHDLNSLALLRTAPVVLVIVNNRGGGIFRFLPLPVSENDLQTYWETPHVLNFEAAAAQFGLPWTNPASISALEDALAAALQTGRSAILEVTTDRAENLLLHREFAEKVKTLPLWP